MCNGWQTMCVIGHAWPKWAFDTVSHVILFERLEKEYSINGMALIWIKSYFKNRTQAVMVNGHNSEPQHLHMGLPQGSILGHFQFTLYSSPLFNIAHSHGVKVHMYADDTQLMLPFNVHDYENAMLKMETCPASMRSWMKANHLKLNDSKTEFVIVGRSNLQSKIENPRGIRIETSTVDQSLSVKNIGATLDNKLEMSSHINMTCRSCYYHLRNISRVRPYLTADAAATLVHSFVSSKIDFHNGLLVGVPEHLLYRLQLVQNTAARIVTWTRKTEHITPVLKALHWLPVHYRIVYKICLLTFKGQQNTAPTYICDMLSSHVPSRSLRAAGQNLLSLRRYRLETADARAYIHAAPRMWNDLPHSLRMCTSLDLFKSQLKTHLFKLAYTYA